MKSANVSNRILRMAQLAMIAAVSVVLVAFVQIPLVPAMPQLKYDMADTPILFAALLFGTGPSLVVLFLVSVIQAFLFGGDGWVGLLMHFVASGAMVVLVGQFYHRRHKTKDAVIGMVLATAARAAIMVPMNYIFTVHVFGTPKEIVDAAMLPGIIPFNLLQAGLNCLLAGVLFKAFSPILRKNRDMIRPV